MASTSSVLTDSKHPAAVSQHVDLVPLIIPPPTLLTALPTSAHDTQLECLSGVTKVLGACPPAETIKCAPTQIFYGGRIGRESKMLCNALHD